MVRHHNLSDRRNPGAEASVWLVEAALLYLLSGSRLGLRKPMILSVLLNSASTAAGLIPPYQRGFALLPVIALPPAFSSIPYRAAMQTAPRVRR